MKIEKEQVMRLDPKWVDPLTLEIDGLTGKNGKQTVEFYITQGHDRDPDQRAVGIELDFGEVQRVRDALTRWLAYGKIEP